MAVTFDAVGPSSAGAGINSTASLTWNHTVGAGSGTMLIAGVSVDVLTDGGVPCTATYGGVSMTSLGRVEAGGGTSGYLQVFYLAGVAAGSANVICTTTGSIPNDMEGGSLSFFGVSGLGTPATANGGATTTPGVTVSPTTAGNIVAGFIATGDTITSFTGSSSEFIINQAGGAGDATGNAAGAQSAAGGSIAMAWSTASAAPAVLAVEVQGAPLAHPGPGLNQGLLPNFPAIIASNAGWRSAGHSR